MKNFNVYAKNYEKIAKNLPVVGSSKRTTEGSP